MDWTARLQEPKYWLLGIAAAFITLHLTLIDRVHNGELFATCALFWLVAGSFIWDKKDTLKLESTWAASLFGAGLLGLAFWNFSTLPDSTTPLRLFPLPAMVGLGLLASGWTFWRQYGKELLVFGLMAIQPFLELMLRAVDLPLFTAKVATVLLWYTGSNVQREGVFLQLPTGRVEVYEACSGLHSMLLMLNVAILFMLIVPLTRMQKIGCAIVGVVLGFIVNAARVALMALLVAARQREAFEYWHSGNGSMVFSMISVALFGVFCWLAFLRRPPTPTQLSQQ